MTDDRAAALAKARLEVENWYVLAATDFDAMTLPSCWNKSTLFTELLIHRTALSGSTPEEALQRALVFLALMRAVNER